MKESTLKELTSILDTTPKLTFRHVEILFDEYARQEIFNTSDLFRDHGSFQSFIQRNIRRFPMDDRMDAVTLSYSRTSALEKLATNAHMNRKHQENFAHQIEAIVGDNKSTKILEVGGGNIPYSSIILGDKGYDITSMDQLYLPSEVLARFNVKSNRALFNHESSVKDYDFVVGRKPCSAINSIVGNCSRSHIPYYIRLCACELESGSIKEWQKILPKIDKDVQFKGAYAYNLGNDPRFSNEVLKKSIDMDEERRFCF